MFIENDKTYKNAQDYANQHDNLVWNEDNNRHTALNNHYEIYLLSSGKIYVIAGRITWYAPSIEEAKQECLADFIQTYGKD